jgi:diguanylate cyclase (GGDEF)-like protein
MTMMTAADSVFAYLEPRQLIYSYPPLNLLWASSYFLLFAAATRQASLLEGRHTDETRPPNPKRRLAWILIPYVSVAVAAGLLVSATLRSPKEPLSYLLGVVIGGLILTAMVMFRQYLVLRENVDLHIRSTQASLTDELTGLANRRRLFQLLEHEARRAVRYERPFSILWIDLDELKTFNDRFGHSTGDQVLIRLARLLVDNVRALDTPARLGGDEFAVLLPETGAAAARIAAARLDASIRSAQVAGVPMSASIGVGSYRTGATVESIVEEADRDLYRVKNERRPPAT